MNDNNLFQNAFEAIDDEFIAEAKSPEIRIATRRKKMSISAVAACVAAVLVAIPSVKILGDLNGNQFTESDDTEIIYITQEITSSESSKSESSQNEPPQGIDSNPDNSDNSLGINSAPLSSGVGSAGTDYDEITITVDDLYFTNISTNGPTNSYEKVYSQNIKYLYINPIPSQRYVTIYEEYYQKPLDQSEAQALADKHIPKMSNALNIALPQYKINTYDRNIEIRAHQSGDEFELSISQFLNRNIVGLLHYGDKNKTILNGQVVKVNQTQNDDEIINSLSDIKQILFDMFDVSFDSVKICRRYYGSGTSGESWLYVYFYNSNAHPLNDLPGAMPFSDFISISFDNCSNHSDDTVSDTELYNVFNIDYWSYRTENHSPLRVKTKKELLPLEKAEEYLNKGYVLAMGGCALCQAEQTPVDFSDYDYVSFEYKGGSNIGDLLLPYYAFYKSIGTAENGNMTFAKTYVPAIDIEGYEEYFINKHNNHNNTDNNNNDIAIDEIINNPKPPA